MADDQEKPKTRPEWQEWFNDKVRRFGKGRPTTFAREWVKRREKRQMKPDEINDLASKIRGNLSSMYHGNRAITYPTILEICEIFKCEPPEGAALWSEETTGPPSAAPAIPQFTGNDPSLILMSNSINGCYTLIEALRKELEQLRQDHNTLRELIAQHRS